MIIYKELNKEMYKGYKQPFVYTSLFYYDVCIEDMGFRLMLKTYDTPVVKTFTDTLFEDYLDEPHALGAFINDTLIGFIEGNYERWHNLYRITNIHIDASYRRKRIGETLLDMLTEYAQTKYQARALVLETQSSNHPAISFYLKMGFLLTGLDTLAYTNTDIENKEVRLEFGKKLFSKQDQ